jgi:hypothetical protein
MNILQSIKSLVLPENPYSKMALGVDVSHWERFTADDLRGVDYIIAKIMGTESAGGPVIDGNWNYYAQLAYDLDVPLMGYVFINPRVFIEGCMTVGNVESCPNEQHPLMGPMLKALANGSAWKQIKMMFADYEEASEWCNPPYHVDSFWMRYMIEDWRNRTKSLMGKDVYNNGHPFPRFEMGIYSRQTWVHQHDTDDYSIERYLYGHPELQIWCANYPRRLPKTAKPADVRASWLPQSDWTPKPFGFTDKREKPWLFWQFSGDPDWNLFNGTKDELYSRVGYVPHGTITPPVVVPPPAPAKRYFLTVNTSYVNVRTKPGITGKDVGDLPAGTTVEVVPDMQADGYPWYKVIGGLYVAKTGNTTIKEG